LGLIVVAPEAIDIVFGRRWHNATPVVQILATVGIAIAIQNLNGIVLQAQGKTRLVFRYSCVLFAGGLIAFIVGLQWGIVGVAACFAAVNVVVQPAYLHLTARSMEISLGQCGRALSGVVQATVVAIAAALITRGLLVADGAPATLRLVATIAAATALYGFALIWRAPDVVSELRDLRPRRSTPAPAEIVAA